jgi:hypothetical protein
MRRIGMHRWSLVVTASAFATLAGGCATADSPAASNTSPGAPTAVSAPPPTPAATVASMPGAVMPPPESPTGGIPPSAHRETSAATPTRADGDPQQGRDLVGPPVILTGVVSVRGTCTVLIVQGRRWALVGQPAHALVDGRHVTVRGRPARVPLGCAADFALTVRGVG